MLIGSEDAEPFNRILFRNWSDSCAALHVIAQSLHVSYDLVLSEVVPENLVALASRIRRRAASSHGKARARATRSSPRGRGLRSGKGRLAS
jgi:hypothetical protein